MTGPAHYREAERLLKESTTSDDEGGWRAARWVQLAQVHATLAAAAAAALGSSHAESRAWADAAGTGLGGPG
jgi:hypothetical protein